MDTELAEIYDFNLHDAESKAMIGGGVVFVRSCLCNMEFCGGFSTAAGGTWPGDLIALELSLGMGIREINQEVYCPLSIPQCTQWGIKEDIISATGVSSAEVEAHGFHHGRPIVPRLGTRD